MEPEENKYIANNCTSTRKSLKEFEKKNTKRNRNRRECRKQLKSEGKYLKVENNHMINKG